MKIRTGFDIAFDSGQPTPMILMLSVHPSRMPDVLTPHVIRLDPPVPVHEYRDRFDNICHRIVAPPGRIAMSASFEVQDTGQPDDYAPAARQIPVQDLPDDVLVFLLGSRYCDTDKLAQTAWNLFGNTPEGWARVQAIVDYTHNRIRFDYMRADATRSAHDGHTQQEGVCRDFAHLAVTLCRCMNIPARYATGYLGDIGVPKDPAPMDFSAWFEVFLEGPEGPRWYTFDARHNRPRIGRIVMARGRDATDVAITTNFGFQSLARFDVHTDEVF
ncbi:transglutaminase-like domain-containing protein [Methylobacterium gregans]|uniref:Transglutaminase-like domain-containing protein n=1 Tax=Methylobacterium gregans TaxID=374424 RepID=A0AA37MD33_9HYPH|nr:transglutaminase family protein [Methylobacterium gregans]MDQ0521614.1 transglutaminase-like putative cysteine protease [Methylobacterium gregans]GJD80144.1 hypothetical protein NBEOAGPD_3383 [Methylobacterium gregans]GLS55391.1 transglutaminase [Methylobacterium gregans]